MHIPVLLNEVLELLDIKEKDFVIDGTFGRGGHAKAFTEKISSDGRILGIDWDENAVASGKSEMNGRKNIILIQGNYSDLPEILEKQHLPKADKILLDLGFSSDQLEDSKRGFSFMKDEVLDMRYFPESARLTAAEIVNRLKENELADIFYRYGQERFSRKIARKIIEFRKKQRILTTGQLAEIIKSAVPKNYERGRINPATRTFQALRIYINEELDNLENFLKNIPDLVQKQGRVAIISFHSLEDRLVKNYFREMEKSKIAKILTKKPIIATEKEILNNAKARSAKLRAIQII